jgi:hypothetical protein
MYAIVLIMTPILLTLADVSLSTGSDGGLVHALFLFLIIGICVGAIWWVGRWFITKLALPALAMTIWTGLFILIGLIVLINFLLSLVGKGFIRW